MVSVVFIIAVLNLAMGFILAIAIERQRVVYLPHIRFRGTPHSPQKQLAKAAEVEVLEPTSSVPVAGALAEQMPAAWLKVLEEAGLEATSFAEASVQVLKLEVGGYRDDLADIEELVRSCIVTKKSDAARESVNELVQLNEEWMEMIGESSKVLSEQHDAFGANSETGVQLEQLLIKQVPVIEDCCAIATMLDVDQDEQAGKKLNDQIAQLITMAHDLRDAMKESLVVIMNTENRLESLGRKEQFDPATELHNRLGIEVVFQNWWREDVERSRSVAVAMVDIDGFEEVNKRVSTRVGDRVLGTIGRFLESLVTQDSGLNRVSRFSGQRFLFFFGDVVPRKAVNDIEKVRQSLEATTFVFGEEELHLTFSCGVTEVRPDETTTDLFARLDGLVNVAKEAGRNRSIVDDGDGPDDVVPQKHAIAPRRIAIN